MERKHISITVRGIRDGKILVTAAFPYMKCSLRYLPWLILRRGI